MSTLNSRLQLSILNRKKSKNLAEQGFTLIELLITVVILGTLSSIALPTFMNQQDKAKAAGVVSLVRNAASSCQALQVTDDVDNFVPLEHVIGDCENAGVETTFVLDDTLGSGSPGEGWETPASATISPVGEVTVDEGTKAAEPTG